MDKNVIELPSAFRVLQKNLKFQGKPENPSNVPQMWKTLVKVQKCGKLSSYVCIPLALVNNDHVGRFKPITHRCFKHARVHTALLLNHRLRLLNLSLSRATLECHQAST